MKKTPLNKIIMKKNQVKRTPLKKVILNNASKVRKNLERITKNCLKKKLDLKDGSGSITTNL